MASIDDLKNVLKDTLDNRGVLNQIRARIRAEVFSALDDQTEPRPVLSNENMFINELIREYLEFNKYKFTNSVLLSETGQPKEPIDREFLNSELHIKDTSTSEQIPLLYSLVSYFLQHQHEKKSPKKVSPRSPRSNQRKRSVSPVSDSHAMGNSKGIVYHAR